jgi:hypothetical protein
MLEVAYNRQFGGERSAVPFSRIMKDELFGKVFGLCVPGMNNT